LSSKGAKIIIMDIDSEESILSARDEFLKISPNLDLLSMFGRILLKRHPRLTVLQSTTPVQVERKP